MQLLENRLGFRGAGNRLAQALQFYRRRASSSERNFNREKTKNLCASKVRINSYRPLSKNIQPFICNAHEYLGKKRRRFDCRRSDRPKPRKKLSNIRYISYAINQSNEIIFVNDAWSELALANNAPELVAEKVLNRNLWDFVSDDATIELYQQLVGKARAGRSINFNFRCDAPDLRRLFEMKITLQTNQNVQFDSRLITAEKRVYQNVFQTDAQRADGVIVACSWCKKIETRGGIWREIEDALSNLKPFESEKTVQLSHGMCVSCFRSISEKHRNTFELKPA